MNLYNKIIWYNYLFKFRRRELFCRASPRVLSILLVVVSSRYLFKFLMVNANKKYIFNTVFTQHLFLSKDSYSTISMHHLFKESECDLFTSNSLNVWKMFTITPRSPDEYSLQRLNRNREMKCDTDESVGDSEGVHFTHSVLISPSLPLTYISHGGSLPHFHHNF